MSEGWDIRQLSDICISIEDGDWIEKKDQSNSGIRLIQTGNIGIGQYKDKSEKAKYITEDTFERLRCTEVFEGDVLVSRLPEPVGRACLVPQLPTRCITAVDCSIIRLNQSVILPQWFLYYTQSDEYFSKVRKECSGTTRDRISRKKLEVITVPIPSLAEQQRIVSILDKEVAKIESLRANAVTSLQAAKDLFQASLKIELEPQKGWHETSIGELCTIYNGGTPSTSIAEYWDGGIQWITPKDMGKLDDMYVSSCERNISAEGVENSSAKVLPERSVILSSRAPIGYVAINTVPMATNQGCKGFIPFSNLLPEFLYFFFLSETKMLNGLGTGATFKEVSGKKLGEILLHYPSIQEQKAIAERIISLSKKCSILQENYNQTISLCDDLKQALLRKVFNGEL